MAYLFALCAIALWSTNAVTAKFVLVRLPVEQVQFLQFLGALLVFLALAIYRRRDSHGGRRAGANYPAWLLGATGLAGTMIFQYIAFSIGPITEVNIIAYAWPLIAAILITAAGGTGRPGLLVSLAIVGFFGVTLVIGGDRFATGTIATNAYGFAAAIASAVCMAVYTFAIGRTRVHANDVLLPGAIVGLVITAAWCLAADPQWNQPWALAGGLYLGAGPMGLGYLFWSWAMQRDKSGYAALFGFLTPITSTGLLLASGEALATLGAVGAAVVVACCVLIGLRMGEEERA